jgi:hypothetical protein
MMRKLIDPSVVAGLERLIADADAVEFANQYPAYVADMPGETRKALAALQADPIHRERYANFMADMVYGERAVFTEAMETVNLLVAHLTEPSQ